jgi:inorganic pyrophosphatase
MRGHGTSDEEREPTLLAVVETPKGSRNKFAWSGEDGAFRLKKVLPAGAEFPFDFGFIPHTRSGDGDPLDVLILMDEPAFPGCRIDVRLVGVIEARQVERDGSEEMNDRLIAVAAASNDHRDVRSIDDLSSALLDEIEHFFVAYNEIEGRRFEPRARRGPKAARRIVDATRT